MVSRETSYVAGQVGVPRGVRFEGNARTFRYDLSAVVAEGGTRGIRLI
ncbi:MAG: hypothetical protein HY775_01745 [Acidobacteria bacterium]|nr:hypothetical protein [Acidobacteriota bacterium]